MQCSEIVLLICNVLDVVRVDVLRPKDTPPWWGVIKEKVDSHGSGPGGVERHEYDAMKGSQGGVDQASDLFLTENHGQAECLFRIRSFRRAPGLLERLDVEETQRRQSLVHRVWRQLPLLEQRGLILADVFRT